MDNSTVTSESALLPRLTYELLKSISKPLLKFITMLYNCLSSSYRPTTTSPELLSKLSTAKKHVLSSLASRDHEQFSTSYWELVSFLRSIDELDMVQLQLWEPIILTCFGHFKRFFVSFKMLEEILGGLFSVYSTSFSSSSSSCNVNGSLERQIRKFTRYNDTWLSDIVRESSAVACASAAMIGGYQTDVVGA